MDSLMAAASSREFQTIYANALAYLTWTLQANMAAAIYQHETIANPLIQNNNNHMMMLFDNNRNSSSTTPPLQIHYPTENNTTSSSESDNSAKSLNEFCLLCQTNVSALGPRKHILQFHLNRPVFVCQLCQYSHNYDRFAVVTHLRHMHTDASLSAVDDRSAQFADEIARYERECFSRKRRCSTDVDSNSKHSRMTDSQQQSSGQIAIPVEREYRCVLCLKTYFVSAIVRHVTSRHIQLKLFKCAVCPFSHRSNAETVRRHMAKMHNGMQAEVIDASNQYRAEIDAKITMCFPSYNIGGNNDTVSEESDENVENNNNQQPNNDTTNSIHRPIPLMPTGVNNNATMQHTITTPLAHPSAVAKMRTTNGLFTTTSLPLLWSSPPSAQVSVSSSAAAALDRRQKCSICCESYISISEHAFAHLNCATLFGCKLCSYTHKTSIPTVHRHIKNKHPDSGDTRANLIDRRIELKMEIDLLKKQIIGIDNR